MFANSRENFYIFPPGAQCTIVQRQHTNASRTHTNTCKGDKRTYCRGEMLLSYVLRAYGAFDTQYSMLQLYVNVTFRTVNMKPRQVRKQRSRGWVRRCFNSHTRTVVAESNVRTHPGKCLLCFKFKFEIRFFEGFFFSLVLQMATVPLLAATVVTNDLK